MNGARVFAMLVLATTLAACSTVPRTEREQQQRADYEAAAGPAQNSFRFFTGLWSWQPLGRDLLVVYTRPQEAWLLDVPGCINLDFTNAIGLTSNLHQVSVGFDKVLTGRHDLPCTITRIRPVDVKRVKASEVERRKVEEKPREAATPAQ